MGEGEQPALPTQGVPERRPGDPRANLEPSWEGARGALGALPGASCSSPRYSTLLVGRLPVQGHSLRNGVGRGTETHANKPYGAGGWGGAQGATQEGLSWETPHRSHMALPGGAAPGRRVPWAGGSTPQPQRLRFYRTMGGYWRGIRCAVTARTRPDRTNGPAEEAREINSKCPQRSHRALETGGSSSSSQKCI